MKKVKKEVKNRFKLGIIIVLMLLSIPESKAQDLEDFKRAASSSGVSAIPFESIRREAASIAKEVDYAKSNARYSYDDLKRTKTNLLKDRKLKEEAIEKEKKFVEDLKAKSDSYSSSIEDDLKDLKEELEDINEQIDETNEEIEEAIEAAKRLWNARGGLREVFEDAEDEVSRAKSNPKNYLGSDASDDDIDTLKDYLDDIEDEMESGKRVHKEQEDGVKNTEKNLRALLAKTSY